MEILNFRPVLGKGSLVAEFDLWIPRQKMTIFNFKVIRTKKGAFFAGRPSYMKDYGGTKKFFPYFSFEESLDKEFDRQVKEALDPFLQTYAHELNMGIS